jgi:hypothetical protein
MIKESAQRWNREIGIPRGIYFAETVSSASTGGVTDVWMPLYYDKAQLNKYRESKGLGPCVKKNDTKQADVKAQDTRSVIPTAIPVASPVAPAAAVEAVELGEAPPPECQDSAPPPEYADKAPMPATDRPSAPS